VQDNLVNTLTGFIQTVCPVSRPLRRESQAKAKAKARSQT
jgi:ArsR family transcriptional regulator